MSSGPGDVLHMFIEDAEQHVHALGQVGRTLAAGWQSAQSAIDGASGGLGADAIGQAFAAGFLPASQSVRTMADQIPPAFAKLHTGGNQAVQLYRAQAVPPPALLSLLQPPA